MSTPAEAARGDGWAPTGPTIAVLVLCGVLVNGQMYAVLPLFELMSTSFGVSPAQVAWTATAFAIAYACGALLSGPLSDWLGQRRVVVAALVATGAATAVVPASAGLVVACALRAVQGFAAGSFGPPLLSYIGQHVRPARRALVFSCFASSMLGSAVVLQVVAQLVGDAWGWRAVFFLSGPCLLAVAVAARAVLRPARSGQLAGARAAFVAMPRLLRAPPLLLLYAACLTMLTCFVGIYAAIALAGPPSIAGDPVALLALRASGLPALVAMPAALSLLTRVGAPARLIVGLGIASAAALAMAVVSGSVLALAGLLLVFVAAAALAAPAMMQSITARVAPGEQGGASALFAFLIFLGAGVGPLLAAALASRGFAAIALAVAGLLAVGAALAALSAWAAARARSRPDAAAGRVDQSAVPRAADR
ncbi:MFS transporter [Saccharopolyspora griseoalba]|uniref:MFS transporter n=1 Tax=Saccharopolyspora griseoalba TaxID=1431848 RepID=A0ABW2LI97_9PSEU